MPALLPSRVDAGLLLVAAAWGSTYLVAKELVTPDSVVALLAARMLFAAAALGVVLGVRRSGIAAREWRIGIVLGTLLAAVFTLETFGIAHTSATNAGLIISLTIVFTPLLDAATARRRPSGRFLLACTVAVAGVALLAGNGELRPPALGDLLIVGAAIVRAVHVTAMHRLTPGPGWDAANLTTVQLATCAALFTMSTLFAGDSLPAYLSGFDARDAMLFVYLGLVCTVFAFLVQMWAVRRTSPARVSLLLGTEPVWAAIIGVALAGDRVTPLGLVGIALILVGTAWGRSIDQQANRPARTQRPAADPSRASTS